MESDFRQSTSTEPGSWALNKDGTTEDYFVIYHDNKLELFHVASRSPYRIEQIDLETSSGAAHWQHVQSFLVSGGAAGLEPGLQV